MKILPSKFQDINTPGPCYAHFNTRYAIGTHAAGWDEIEEFSTSAAHGFYVRFKHHLSQLN